MEGNRRDFSRSRFRDAGAHFLEEARDVETRHERSQFIDESREVSVALGLNDLLQRVDRK
jgi:hypothetical protein